MTSFLFAILFLPSLRTLSSVSPSKPSMLSISLAYKDRTSSFFRVFKPWEKKVQLRPSALLLYYIRFTLNLPDPVEAEVEPLEVNEVVNATNPLDEVVV